MIKKSLVDVLLKWLQVIAIFLAGLWAISTYWYEKIILPGKEPTFIVISSKNQISGIKDSNYIVQSDILIKNLSKARAYVISSTYIFTAFTIDPIVDDTEYVNLIKSSINTPNFYIPKFYCDNTSIINSGKMLKPGYSFDPGEEFTIHLISLVPRNESFDAVRFEFCLNGAKRDLSKKNITRTAFNIDSTGLKNDSVFKLPENRLLTINNFEKLINETGYSRSWCTDYLTLKTK